ncbi:MAG: hypothetical protein WED59_00020 [Candidatus Woykebacteria bacterium]
MAKTYKDKKYLKQMYDKLGSTRNVAKHIKVAQQTIRYWMRKFGIPRIPKLYLSDNNSGRGRITELYVLGHPFFKKNMKDLGEDDKSKGDVVWKTDKVNIKGSHYRRFMFRVKKKRHDVSVYICCCYMVSIDLLIPVETFMIPASKVPHSGITLTLNPKSKYHKYKLSSKRDIEFSAKEEKKYNERFKKEYSKYLKRKH